MVRARSIALVLALESSRVVGQTVAVPTSASGSGASTAMPPTASPWDSSGSSGSGASLGFMTSATGSLNTGSSASDVSNSAGSFGSNASGSSGSIMQIWHWVLFISLIHVCVGGICACCIMNSSKKKKKPSDKKKKSAEGAMREPPPPQPVAANAAPQRQADGTWSDQVLPAVPPLMPMVYATPMEQFAAPTASYGQYTGAPTVSSYQMPMDYAQASSYAAPLMAPSAYAGAQTSYAAPASYATPTQSYAVPGSNPAAGSYAAPGYATAGFGAQQGMGGYGVSQGFAGLAAPQGLEGFAGIAPGGFQGFGGAAQGAGSFTASPGYAQTMGNFAAATQGFQQPGFPAAAPALGAAPTYPGAGYGFPMQQGLQMPPSPGPGGVV